MMQASFDQSGWESVRTEFLDKVRSELSEEEMKILEDPGIETVRVQLDDLLKNHRSQGISKILQKMQPFLQTFEGFYKAFDVMSNADKCASLAWGIFRVALQMGNFALQRIGMVSNHLRNITKILDRLQRTEKQLPRQPELHEALKAAYADILTFYLKVIRYLRKGVWWKRVFVRPLQGFDCLYGEIERNLKTNLKHVGAETLLASIAIFHEGRHRNENGPIFQVPDSQNLHFIGRGDILSDLGTYLDNSTSSAPTLLAVCLYGTAGVGKSMIVQQYTHTQRSKFRWILWVAADTEQKLNSSFRAIATRLEIPNEYFSDKAGMIDQVKMRLSSATFPWLLVFDNADDISLIDEYWPLGGNGNVIITTRDCVAPARFSCHRIQVSEFLIPEGIHFLESLLAKKYPSRPKLDKERRAAADLVCEIGALPITLCHAVATLGAERSIRDLLRQYRDPAQNKLLLEIDSERPRAQRTVLGKTWEASYDKLRTTNYRGAYALQCLAWVDHDGMPADVFRNINLFPDKGMLFPTDADYQAAVYALTRSSLVTSSTGGALLVNRMVQITTILRMTHEERIETFRSVAVLLESRFPQPYASSEAIFPGVVKHAGECQKLIDHVLSLVKNYENYLQGEKIEKFGSLLQRAALYILEIDNRQGERLLKMSLDMKWTEEGHVVPHIQMNLAWNHMRHGNLAEAKSLGSTSVSLFESALGDNHVLTAWAYCNYGRILAFNTEFKDACLYHRRAIKVYESKRLIDPENNTLRFALFIAQNYLVTAKHCQLRGDILGDIYEPSIHNTGGPNQAPLLTEEVKELLKKLLESCKAGLELSNQKYASVFPNKQTLAWIELTLCWILLDLGWFNEAEKHNSRALEHVKDRFSPDGCGVGVITVQRADILNGQGRVAEAEAEYTKARSLLEKKMGRDNPLTALAYHKTGNFYCRRGNFTDAVPFYKVALESFEKSYGESHPTTATAMNNLGVALINIRQREPGLQFLKRALKTRRDRFPSSHKLVVRLTTNIAFLEAHSNSKPEENRASKSSELESETALTRDNLSTNNLMKLERLQTLTVPHTPLTKVGGPSNGNGSICRVAGKVTAMAAT